MIRNSIEIRQQMRYQSSSSFRGIIRAGESEIKGLNQAMLLFRLSNLDLHSFICSGENASFHN